MKKNRSITDISKELNLSIATISYVINGKGIEKRISPKVIKRIEDYITETGYRPNKLGQTLRSGKTFSIGMIIENITDPFFSRIVSEIETLLLKKNYILTAYSCKNDLKITQKIINHNLDYKVDGLIIAPSESSLELYKKYQKNAIPTVYFDRNFDEIESCNVLTNNYDGIIEACNHLIHQSYKEIAFVQIDSNQNQIISRSEAYIDFAKKNNLNTYFLKIPFEYQNQFKDFDELLINFLKKFPKIDSIIFGNNFLTLKGYKILKSNKKLDLGIIGYDNHFFHELMEPTITCISQPFLQIAEKIVEKLLFQIEHKKALIETNIVPISLIIGESTKKKNK